MSNFGQINQSYRNSFVSNLSNVLTSGSFRTLAPEQIGLFSLSEDGTISVATGAEDKLQFAQGIKDFKAKGKTFGGGHTNAPRKSVIFSPSDIKEFRGVKANKFTRGEIVALGYDGVDASKKLTAMLDVKDLVIHIRLWGNLIHKITGNAKDLKAKIYVDKGCLPNGFDINATVSGEKIADSILEQIEKSPLAYGYKLTDLISAKKIKKYANAPDPVTGLVPFHKFTVSIPDDGTGSALGLVQSQYPGKLVTRVSRIDITSTYEIWTQDTFSNNAYSATTPSDVSLSERVVADCEVCPSGSTKVNSVKVFELKGLSSLSAPVIANSVSVTLVGNSNLTKTYLVLMPDTTVDNTVITAGTNLGYTTKVISTTRDVCNFSAKTYAWSNVGSATKAPSDWKITLADGQCGTDRLSELQENYKGYIVSIDEQGQCVHTYKITNYSEPVEPGCYPEDYKFNPPSAFEHTEWVKFTQTLLVPDCSVIDVEDECVAVGVIFESKVEENPLVDNYNYGYHGYDHLRNDPVHIEISVQSLDPNASLCDEPDYPVTKLQSVVLPKGEGRYVIEREKESLGYENKRWSVNPLINDAFGFHFNAKDGIYYDCYQLKIKTEKMSGGFSQTENDSYTYSFWFPEGKGRAFENLVNSVIAKNNLNLKPVYL